MKKAFTFVIDTDNVSSLSDEYLAACWYRAQFLPVEYGDHDACEVVRAIGVEIIKRWMQSQPVPMFQVQSHDYWHQLACRFARWTGTEWIARPVAEKSHVPADDQPEGV